MSMIAWIVALPSVNDKILRKPKTSLSYTVNASKTTVCLT